MLTALVLSALPSLPAETPPPSWLEISASGGRVTVITDAGEKAGRKVALQITQFDRSLQKRFTWIRWDDEPPLTVFASADEAMVRSMAPDTTDAEKDNAFSSYLMAEQRHVGAVRTDLPETSDKDRSPSRGFHRGRVSQMIDRSLGGAPLPWLARGLITFLSDAVVKDKEVQVGRMSLAQGDGGYYVTPPAAEFLREARAPDRKFDLQAALFIHYLLVAENSRNAPALDGLLTRLAAGETLASEEPALAKVAALYAGFPKYLASKKFPPLKLPIDTSTSASSFTVRPLPVAEALMLRAEVLFELNRPVDTRGVLRQVKAADPTMVRPLEIEAVLFEREHRSTESKKAIEAAIQMGSKNASLYYRLAQLQWSRTMARPVLLSAQKLLETARDLSPGDPLVLSYLAEIQGDLGLIQPALENARQGAKGAPTDPYAHMAFAKALWNAGQTDPAVASARQALGLAKGASQKQRVQEFITFAARNKRAQTAGTKPYRSQFGPPPAGAFGEARAAGGGNRVVIGQAQTDSADASAITECFAKRSDAACARAVPALESACAESQATSCVSLGSLYDGGFGIPRDRPKAAALYKTACDRGDKPGCARLAVLEAQGLGVPLNAVRAKKTLEALCEGKVPEACIGLAQLLRRTGFALDRDRASALLQSACDLGSAEACGLRTSR